MLRQPSKNLFTKYLFFNLIVKVLLDLWRPKPQPIPFFFSSRWHIHHNCWICPEASYSYGTLVCICILNLDISPVNLSHVTWLFVQTEELKRVGKLNFTSLYPHKVCINQLIQLSLFVFQNLFTSLIILENLKFFFFLVRAVCDGTSAILGLWNYVVNLFLIIKILCSFL